MRRSLVLGDETARHPFLQSLPPHVRGGGQPVLRIALAAQTPPTRLEQARDALRQRWQGLNLSSADVRMFLLAYCACFIAVSAFIW